MNNIDLVQDDHLNEVNGGILGAVIGLAGLFLAGYAIGWQLAEALDKKK